MSVFSLFMHFLSCVCRLASRFLLKKNILLYALSAFWFYQPRFKKIISDIEIFFTLLFCHANEHFFFCIYICNRIIYFKFIKGEWSTKLRQRGFLSPLILTLSWILDTWCFIIKRNVHPKVFIYCSGNIFYSYVT